jgi:YHS domain-containing protein
MHNLSRRHAVLILAVAATVSATSMSVAMQKATLGIKGYDPVAYFTDKRPVIGDPQYRHEWDGVTYQFASARHLEMFKTDPDRYLPQYNSLCAASLAKGVVYEGNPEHWLVVDGRLYLFGGPVSPSLMANAAVITRKADENWPQVSRAPDTPRP